MHFGSDSGAKLIGMWKNNRKDGMGVLSSGNGEVVASTRLFMNDKPINKNNLYDFVDKQPSEEILESTDYKPDKNLFQKLINLINKKVTKHIGVIRSNVFFDQLFSFHILHLVA